MLLRRSHAVLANWLTGAGIAILYTAFWAAHAVYTPAILAEPGDLRPAGRGHRDLRTACGSNDAIAMASYLGLAGGFATPAAKSSHDDHPIGLFGYLLCLDGALLVLAHKRRWPILTTLSLLATFLYEAVWIGLRMGPGRIEPGHGRGGRVRGSLRLRAARGARTDPGPSRNVVDPKVWLTEGATVFLPLASASSSASAPTLARTSPGSAPCSWCCRWGRPGSRGCGNRSG